MELHSTMIPTAAKQSKQFLMFTVAWHQFTLCTLFLFQRTDSCVDLVTSLLVDTVLVTIYKWTELMSVEGFGVFEDIGLDNEEGVHQVSHKFCDTVVSEVWKLF